MAQIDISLLTTLNLATHLHAMFSDLYGFSKNLVSDGAGNVGIGTASPAVRLDVRGSAPSARLFDTAGGNSLASLTADAAGAVLEAGFVSTPTDMVFKTSSAVRMRLTAAGDLVLDAGRAPPALTVNGSVVFNFTSDTNLRISARGSDGTTRVANITLA